MQHKLNPEQGKFDFVLTAGLYMPNTITINPVFFLTFSPPLGLESLKPQRKAPGAAWKMDTGNGIVVLNLMRMKILNRTHQMQVGSMIED